MHIEARLLYKALANHSLYWDNRTVRDLSVTVLCTKEHSQAPDRLYSSYSTLVVGVVSSCLETLCVRAVVAETGLLSHQGYGPHRLEYPVGVPIDLQLASVPQLRQLLACSHQVNVTGVQEAASQVGLCLTVNFSALKAAFWTCAFKVR